MIRLRTPRIFGERQNQEASKLPKSVIIIACEGKTEENYFKIFSSKNKIIKVKDISVEILEKQEASDTKSAPMHVLNLLDEYARHYQIDNDELWMVIDRDRQNNSKKQLEEIINSCKKNNYNIALSNPCFELWLLLHVRDLSEYDDLTIIKIKANKRISSSKKSKRFIEKELSLTVGGYKKGKVDTSIFLRNINNAIKRAKQLDLSYPKRKIDNLGTTVFLLVEKIIA